MDDLTTRTGRSALRYIPSIIIPALAGIVAVPILTRLFSPSQYGDYVLVISTIALMTTFSAQWLRNSTVRFYTSYKMDENLKTFYSTTYGATILGAVFISLVIVLLVYFDLFFNPEVRKLMLIGLLAFWGNTFFIVSISFFRASQKPGLFSTFRALHAVGKVFWGLCLVIIFKMGVEGLILGIFISGFTLLPFIIKYGKFSKVLSIKNVSYKDMKAFAAFGFPIVWTLVSIWLLNLSNRYIIEFLRSSTEVGLYSIAYSLSSRSLEMVFMVLMLAAYPIIVEAWEKAGREYTSGLISNLSRFFFLISTPIAVWLSISAKNLISIFSPHEYLEGYRVMPFIILCFFLNGFTQYINKSFELSKKTYIVGIIMFVSGLINVGLTFILVNSFGFIGAGYANVIAFTIFTILSFVLARRYLVWKLPGKSILKIILSSLLMGLVVYIINVRFIPWLAIVLSMVAAFIVYFVSLKILKESDLNEILRFFGLTKAK